jgi:hypothetical protein
MKGTVQLLLAVALCGLMSMGTFAQTGGDPGVPGDPYVVNTVVAGPQATLIPMPPPHDVFNDGVWPLCRRGR